MTIALLFFSPRSPRSLRFSRCWTSPCENCGRFRFDLARRRVADYYGCINSANDAYSRNAAMTRTALVAATLVLFSLALAVAKPLPQKADDKKTKPIPKFGIEELGK